MKVRNPSDRAMFIPAGNMLVGAAETVDVPDELGVSLIDQGWVEVKAKPSKQEESD